MGKKIDLSVIIPVYQSEQYIAECLQSILCQKKINIEVLCMDDGSTDQSSHIIQNIAKSEKRVQWIPLEHQGVSHTRNEGLKRAKGEYVFFLDADDKVDGKTFAKALQKAQNIRFRCMFLVPKPVIPITHLFGFRKHLVHAINDMKSLSRRYL